MKSSTVQRREAAPPKSSQVSVLWQQGRLQSSTHSSKSSNRDVLQEKIIQQRKIITAESTTARFYSVFPTVLNYSRCPCQRNA